MNINRGAILCLGYIIGLFLTFIWGGVNPDPTIRQWGFILGAIALSTGVIVITLPRHFFKLRPQFWLAVGLTALLAVGYFQIRIPRPQTGDIFSLTQTESSLTKYPLQVTGTLLKNSVLKEDQKQRFWLKVKSIQTKYKTIPTKGIVYVTLPTETTVLKEGFQVQLQGRLYQPKASQAKSFSFAHYLRQNNAFLGLSAWDVKIIKNKPTFPEKIRQRIQFVHSLFLPDNIANLLSSMVLDRRAVNLSTDVYDLWRKAGLAHTVAASGFHVSLLLGVVLFCVKNKSEKIQFTVGVTALLGFLFLTGLQPSILRATLMGIGGLIALVLDRKIKPLSLLILTATLLLIYNPLWIWDLGFQLSFLATFGLFTTLKPIEKYFNFLPPTISTLIAVPIAASIWTLPLLAYQFNVIALYSIPLNILVSPLVIIVSLGGMLSSAIGLIIPPAGGAIAYLIGFPLQWMMWIVEQTVKLPLANFSVASLHWSQLLLIYGVMLLIWLSKWGQKHARILIYSLITLFITFLTLHHFNTTQLTILASRQVPVIVAQSAGKTVVINSESEDLVKYNLLPFLRQSGINEIHALVNFDSTNKSINWQDLEQDMPIQEKFDVFGTEKQQLGRKLAIFEPHKIGKIRFQLLQEKSHILELKLGTQTFYILEKQNPEDNFIAEWNQGFLIANAKNIDFKTWQTLKPQGAIAIGSRQEHFLAPNKIVYWTEADGTIQWTPERGLSSLVPTDF